MFIAASRDIQKLSKKAIYCLHRNEVNIAKQQARYRGLTSSLRKQRLWPRCYLQSVKRARISGLDSLDNIRHGALSSALEEYAEAKSFLHFLQDRRLITLKELGICNEAGLFHLPAHLHTFDRFPEYLGGVVDLTGELGRLAVIRATARYAMSSRLALDSNLFKSFKARLRSRDAAAVREIYALTEELFGALTQFDFRNGGIFYVLSSSRFFCGLDKSLPLRAC